MGVQSGPTVAQCDIANRRRDFRLLLNRDALVLLALPIEVTEHDGSRFPDGLTAPPARPSVGAHCSRAPDRFIADISNQRERARLIDAKSACIHRPHPT